MEVYDLIADFFRESRARRVAELKVEVARRDTEIERLKAELERRDAE